MDKLTRTGQDFENEFCSGCDCVYYGEPNGCNHPDGNCGSYTYFTLVADRLAEYEDSNLTPAEVAELAQAKADGRLVVLPCKVGDTVYEPFAGKVYEKTVDRIIINRFTTPQIWIETKLPFATPRLERWDIAIGKTIFLTREEAEKALKESENNA